MNYVFKNKLNLEDLAGLERQPKKVLIFEPRYYFAVLYRHYLQMNDFEVNYCGDADLLDSHLELFSPHVLIFSVEDCDRNPGKTRYLRQLSQTFPGLWVVTIGNNLQQDTVGQLMAAGVCGHINRVLTRPQDLVTVVKSLLR